MKCLGAVGSGRRGEQLLNIDRIEPISPVAEVATDLDFPPLGEHRTNLLGPQAPQHADHALA